MQRTVQDIMSRDVVVAHTTTPYKDLVRLLAEHRIAALPIVDDNRHPVGIVSETDLTAQQAAALRPDAHIMAVHVMTTPAVTTHPETSVNEAARLMWNRKIKRLPVVDHTGVLMGLVARADLLKVFLRPDEQIRLEIVDQISADLPELRADGLQVEVHDGEVTVRGRVERREQATRLRELARGVEGVVAVHDRLIVELDEPSDRMAQNYRGSSNGVTTTPQMKSLCSKGSTMERLVTSLGEAL